MEEFRKRPRRKLRGAFLLDLEKKQESRQAVSIGYCQDEGDGEEKVHDFKKAGSFSNGGQQAAW